MGKFYNRDNTGDTSPSCYRIAIVGRNGSPFQLIGIVGERLRRELCISYTPVTVYLCMHAESRVECIVRVNSAQCGLNVGASYRMGHYAPYIPVGAIYIRRHKHEARSPSRLFMDRQKWNRRDTHPIHVGKKAVAQINCLG